MPLNLTYADTKERDAPSPYRRRPYKQQLNAVKALFEACDNVVAAGYERNYEEFRLDIELDGNKIMFKDNVGGISKEDWPKLVDIWESGFAMDSPTPSMNAVGGLIAAYVLEADYYVFTKRNSQDAYGVHVEEGVREAHIIEDIPTHLEPDDGQTIVYYDDPNQALLPSDETVREELGIRYQQWLRENNRADFTLTVNGMQVSPPSRPSFIGTPFHFPRQYRFKRPNRNEEPVDANVTVGLADDAEKGGIDLYYQGVCINMCSDSAGDIASLLESAFENHPRLRIVIEFQSADSTQLPWNRDKTTVKTNHPVWEDISDWVVRAARSYAKVQSLSELEDVQEHFFDADWPLDVDVETYDLYTIGKNKTFRDGETATWSNGEKGASKNIKQIISHARRDAHALSVSYDAVLETVHLPDAIDNINFGIWYGNFVANIVNSDEVGYWNVAKDIDDVDRTDLTIKPSNTPDKATARDTISEATAHKRYGNGNQEKYDGWKENVYETAYEAAEKRTDPDNEEDTESSIEDVEPDDGESEDNRKTNKERAQELRSEIVKITNNQEKIINEFNGITEEDKAAQTMLPSNSAADFGRLSLFTPMGISMNTSLGTFNEKLAMQFEAEKLSHDHPDNFNSRGKGFDLKTQFDDVTHLIQLKRSVNTMNAGDAESHAESMSIAEKQDGKYEPYIGIVFGSVSEVPNKIRDAIRDHDGLDKHWQEYILAGAALWEHVTGPEHSFEDVQEVREYIGEMNKEDDEVQDDFTTAANEKLEEIYSQESST